VLWECGPELAAAAINEGCVQQVAAVIAPKLLGGIPARTPLGELGFTSLQELPAWQAEPAVTLGPDLLWRLAAQ
jgi:diaminohydroxyphosphoribosylaminopyrimidine deaminase/5-amino-6-(5-phosphoribosylamino)uracil reductase